MQITRLSAAECEDLYRSALPRDFPAAELKPFAEIQRLLESGVYEPLLLTDDAGARLCCRASARRCLTTLPCGTTCAAAAWARRRWGWSGTTTPCGYTTWCWNVSIPPRLPTRPSRGGALDFTCGQARGPRRWKAGCYAVLALPCGGTVPDAALCKELRTLYKVMVPHPYYRGQVIFYGS